MGYQGVRNVNFSENFAYVLNEWFLIVRLDMVTLLTTPKIVIA